MRALLIVLVIGCGGSSKSSSQTMPSARSSEPNCSGASDGMVAMMMEGKEGKGNADARADEFRILIRTRCEDDKWSAEARQCLSEMKTRTDAEQCATKLTDEQQQNLVRDQKAKFGAGTSDPCKGDE
jgi:hypothetical protein